MAVSVDMQTKKRQFGSKTQGTALYSLAEIGAAFGVTLQTIQGVEQRALKKIRHAIEAEAAESGMTVGEWLYGDSKAQPSEQLLDKLVRFLDM